MRIEVKIMRETEPNDPASERKSASVETHARRGETFNVEKMDNVLEGDVTMFTVPDGGRLVLTVPLGSSEVVYDRTQGAAVKTGSQMPDSKVADAPRGAPDWVASAPTTPPPSPQMTPVQPVPTRVQHPPTNPTEAAKAAQQSAPRPAGEKPPLPGSPVGSPPAGNEGKDNK